MSSCLVCISGGVDSSVSAYLLKNMGLSVKALFLRLTGTKGEESALIASKKICSFLDIDLIIKDKRNEFKEKIISYFERSYFSGKTPNCCVLCNPYIKIRTAFKVADSLDMNFIATGHYVRLINGKFPVLLRAKDRRKDQSYFLHRIKREHIKRLIFPLGNYLKDEIKRISKKIGIERFIQEESQDICFFKGDYREFLKKRLSPKMSPGPIVTRSGKILGEHKGLYNYTIGQRRGLGIPDKTPYYVLSIDIKKNQLIVGKKEELLAKDLLVKDINWLIEPSVLKNNIFQVKIRSRHKDALSKLEILPGNKARVTFFEPQMAVTPGQFAVFYKKNCLVGGGEICG